VAYHAKPWKGISTANDTVASEADRGIKELEQFLADSALVAA
jgi:hypothetical protein